MEIEKENLESENIELTEKPEEAAAASVEQMKEADQSDKLMNKIKSFLDLSFETIRVIIVSLIIIFVVRSFVIQPFFVKGSSMEPNFEDGDYLIVDEISYRFEEPKRGDVIIFRYPNNPSEFFIKRIIGLPGETVEIKDNKISIYSSVHPEGIALNESEYLDNAVVTSGNIYQQLGEDEYYVLGDNRVASSDSRRWGILNKRYVIGKAWLRAWPFDDFKIFESQNY